MKEQSENGDMEVRNDFVDVYEKHNVDVVFFGHLHSYERTHGIKNESVNNQEGVVYVQTGGGGGNHEKASPTRNWFTRKVFSDYHYTLVNIEDNMLTITVIDAEGRMRDQFVIEK
jgi:2',3'-cyclic-nucleotide 2'-phosphodiesterase (5'-nucleotidase family)